MCCNDRGFTLIEVMVAVTILAIGMMGLFQTVYSTIGYNMQNQLRAEAVTVGDEVMARELNRPFDGISTSQTKLWSRADSLNRSMNNGFAFHNFSSVRSHLYVSPNSTNVQVKVSWRYKGTPYSHNLASVVSK